MDRKQVERSKQPFPPACFSHQVETSQKEPRAWRPSAGGKRMKEPQKRAEEGEEGGEREEAVPIWDCGSPLYDSFELASVCHLLDRHQMTLPFYKQSASLSGRVCDEPNEMLREHGVVVVGRREKKEKAKKRNKVGLLSMFAAIGFWRRV